MPETLPWEALSEETSLTLCGEMLPKYFIERYLPNKGNTAVKSDNMKHLETLVSTRLNLLTIEYVIKYSCRMKNARNAEKKITREKMARRIVLHSTCGRRFH